MTSIHVLAQREANAESARGRADSAWRAAWWATTRALGQITGKAAIGTAQRAVAEATGQSMDWIRTRTRTGRAFLAVGADIDGIPPGMACECVRAGIAITDEVVERMRTAEAEGLTYRTFIASIGARFYHDTPEGASAATVEAIVAAQPETAGRAVARNPQAQRAADHERVSLHPNAVGRPPETADGKGMRAHLAAANDAEARLSQPIYQAAILLQGVGDVWDTVWPDLSASERAQVDRVLGDLLVTVESLRMRLAVEVS